MDAPALSNQPPELKPTPPLLPALLVGPAALFWLWVLPLGILLALNLQGYRLISGNMDAAQLAAAHRLGLVRERYGRTHGRRRRADGIRGARP